MQLVLSSAVRVLLRAGVAALAAAVLVAVVVLRSSSGGADWRARPSQDGGKQPDAQARLPPASTAQKAQRRESSFRCLHEESLERRSCAFRNLCYDPADETFVFYVPPDELLPRVLVRRTALGLPVNGPSPSPWSSPPRSSSSTAAGEGYEHVAAFPSPFLVLRTELSPNAPPMRDMFTPTVRRATIPATAVWDDAPAVVYMASFWPENFGHALGDDVMAAYQLASRLGVLTPDVSVLFAKNRGCRNTGMTDAERERGCQHHAELFAMLTSAPIRQVGADPLFAAARPRAKHASTPVATEASPPPPVVCMDTLVAGALSLGMRRDHPASEWDGFIRYLLRNQTGDDGAALATLAPDAQRIVILDKQGGRRRPTNTVALAAFLRSLFAVPVDILQVARLPLAEQIRRLRTYSVLVTPCGGLSFASAFMAPGASAVYIGYWDPVANASEHMELYIWNQALAVRSFYYNVHQNETTIRVVAPAEGTPRPWARAGHAPTAMPIWEQYRNYGDVTIDLQRMGRVVYDALRSAELAFHWNASSFSRAHLGSLGD